jgi:TATA-box binding protein (TBP) (component of TFIID and TFIIIB)
MINADDDFFLPRADSLSSWLLVPRLNSVDNCGFNDTDIGMMPRLHSLNAFDSMLPLSRTNSSSVPEGMSRLSSLDCPSSAMVTTAADSRTLFGTACAVASSTLLAPSIPEPIEESVSGTDMDDPDRSDAESEMTADEDSMVHGFEDQAALPLLGARNLKRGSPLTNVICSATLMQRSTDLEIDLNKLHTALLRRGLDAKMPGNIKSVTVKFTTPIKGNVLVSSKGRLVVRGAESERVAFKLIKTVTMLISRTLELHRRLKITDFVVHNLVASWDVGHKVALDKLLHSHQDIGKYDPELFPGLVLRLGSKYDVPVTATLFNSGKFNLTGAKTRQELVAAFNIIMSML